MRALYRTILALGSIFLVAAAALALDGLTDRPSNADAAVVPGNTVSFDGTPSPRLAARLDSAVFAYKTGLVPLVVVSGATGKEGFDEAVAMARYLESEGVPRYTILLDSEGVDTAATAVNTARMLHARGLNTVLITTQYFHVARTRLARQRAGLQVSGSLHARYFEPRDLYSLSRELIGLVFYATAIK
jgi:vancomycin permeability regulator SanA